MSVKQPNYWPLILNFSGINPTSSHLYMTQLKLIGTSYKPHKLSTRSNSSSSRINQLSGYRKMVQSERLTE